MTIQLTIIIALAIFFTPWILRRLNWIQDSHDLQNIATSLGIMATFVGIAIGLWNFDVTNIDEAVPQLLEGMKFAFFTSIAGLASSLILKFLDARNSVTEQGEGNKSSEQVMSEMLSELKNLNKNVSGEGDSSLVMQIQRMRNDITDKQDDLNKEFKLFAEQMTKSNIDALAEAIEKVMGEFNTTINDKLGVTFDNFRTSVENLNQWQAEYKEQISTHLEKIKQTKDAVDGMDDSILSMKESYEHIKDLSLSFEELIKGLNNQLSGSVSFAETMSEVSDDLEGSGKMIKDEVKEIMMGVSNELEETMRTTLTMFGENLASIAGKMTDDFQKVQESLSIK